MVLLLKENITLFLAEKNWLERLGDKLSGYYNIIAAMKCDYILIPMATLLRTACGCVSDSCQSCRELAWAEGQRWWKKGKSDLDNWVETRSGKVNMCWCVYLMVLRRLEEQWFRVLWRCTISPVINCIKIMCTWNWREGVIPRPCEV